MPRVHDLDSPDLSALLGLVEEGAVNMRGFTNAARVSPTTARALLERLVNLGLVEVEREPRGATEILTITLTSLGRAVGSHVREMDALLQRGRRS